MSSKNSDEVRYYCEYCKVWLYNNKVSRQIHENGRTHKENIANYLTNVDKTTREKQKEQDRIRKQLDQIESAALKQYQSDVGIKASPGMPSFSVTHTNATSTSYMRAHSVSAGQPHSTNIGHYPSQGWPVAQAVPQQPYVASSVTVGFEETIQLPESIDESNLTPSQIARRKKKQKRKDMKESLGWQSVQVPVVSSSSSQSAVEERELKKPKISGPSVAYESEEEADLLSFQFTEKQHPVDDDDTATSTDLP